MITHLYHLYAVKHKFRDLEFNHLLKRIVPAVIILGIAYTFVTVLKIHLIRTWFSADFSQSFFSFVNFNLLNISVAGVRLMTIWLLAYHLYQYAQREIKVTQENARLAVISRDAQLNNLAAQLNPHFLFNSLNNIKALIVENPKSARRGIDLLSELLRNSLYNHDSMSIRIKREMDLVRDYLELEKLRFEERLQYCIEADNELDEQLIPRLSIQTLVENAIKHGVIQVKDITLITIKVLRESNFIKITVQNPGRLDPSLS
ncbi:sensor histidine kinase [Pedobacter sp. NJ-S-72]